MKTEVTYLPPERTYVVRRGNRNRYRLGPWPELASAIQNGEGQPWIASRKAAEKVATAALSELPWVWFSQGAFNAGIYVPLFRRLAEDAWVERSTNQSVFPWAKEEDSWGDDYAMRYDAAREFQAMIPGRLRVLVKRFANGHVALLRLLAAVPETEPIATEHPALFYLLARHFDRHCTSAIPRSEVLSLLEMPRKDAISVVLGRPVARAAINLLRKVPAHSIEPNLLSRIACSVKQPGFGHCLPHLPNLTSLTVQVLGTPRLWPLLTPSLIHEIDHRTGWFRYNNPLAELHRAANWLYSATNTARPQESVRFKSANELMEFLGRFSPKFEVTPPAAPEPAPLPDETQLPAPPMRGNADIVPLLTAGALRTEGAERQNCSGQEWQIERALSGQCAFFAMYQPERATLMVENLSNDTAGTRWVIRELRGFDNAETRIATVLHAVEVLAVAADPIWYPSSQEAWWRDESFAFLPPDPVSPG